MKYLKNLSHTHSELYEGKDIREMELERDKWMKKSPTGLIDPNNAGFPIATHIPTSSTSLHSYITPWTGFNSFGESFPSSSSVMKKSELSFLVSCTERPLLDMSVDSA